MELVLVAHGGGAAFQVGDIGVLIGDEQCALELPRSGLVDTEIGGEFHRAAHSLGDVAERPVGENGGIEGRIKIVRIGNDAAEVFFHQVRVLLDGLADGHKENPQFGQGVLEGGAYRNRIHHHVHGYSGEYLLFLQRDAQPVEGAQQFRIDLVQRIVFGGFLGSRVIADPVEIGTLVLQVRPSGFLHRLPVAEGAQAVFGHPVRFAFAGGNGADDILVEPLGKGVGFDVRVKAVFVLRRLLGQGVQYFFAHNVCRPVTAKRHRHGRFG